MTELNEAARILRAGPADARLSLARDASAPPEALYYLMGDSEAEVRIAVADNPSTPAKGFAVIATDTDGAVRATLAKRLSALAPGLPPPQQDRLALMAWTALAQLATDAAEDIRATIAEAVKDLPAAPRDLILGLASDHAIRVAEPVLRLSPILTEEDLLTLVAAPPVAETLTAIARRPAISEAVADGLVASGDAAAITALIGNHTAAIREGTIDALVVQAAERTAWQEPLVRRPALPARAAVALAGFVADHLLAPLCQRRDLPAEATARIRAAVATRLAGTAKAGETAEDAKGRAAILLDAGAMTEALILNAARRSETDFVVAGLAGLSGVPLSAVSNATATRCAKSIAGLCRKAGLGTTATELVVTLLAPGMPGAKSVDPALVGEGELRWRIDALTRAAAR